jgi:hypothetical protein
VGQKTLFLLAGSEQGDGGAAGPRLPAQYPHVLSSGGRSYSGPRCGRAGHRLIFSLMREIQDRHLLQPFTVIHIILVHYSTL